MTNMRSRNMLFLGIVILMANILWMVPVKGQAASDKGSAGNNADVEFYQDSSESGKTPTPGKTPSDKIKLPQTGDASYTIKHSLSGGLMVIVSCYMLLHRWKGEGN